MVKFFSTEHTYRHPWSHVTSAFWRKYPNPLATHVKQIDCYERKLVPTGGAAGSSDPQRMLLVTNRLVACESPIPSWMASVGIPTSAYVAETCVVDPVTKEMVIKSRNISGSSMMTVEETCRYTQHKHNADWTHYTQSAKITAFLPFVSSGLESFSFNSMHEKSKKGLQAIEILCERIRSDGLDSITSLTATFDTFVAKLHSSGAVATAAATAAAPATATATATAPASAAASS